MRKLLDKCKGKKRYIGMIIASIGLITAIVERTNISLHFSNSYHPNMNLHVWKYALRDLIDSREKEDAIWKADCVYKSKYNKPELGAMVSATGGGGLSVVHKANVRLDNNIYYLSNVPTHDYTKGYIFIPNIYTESKQPKLARFIEDSQEVKDILNSTLPIHKKYRAKVSNLLILNHDDTYFISSPENLHIESLNGFIVYKEFNRNILLANYKLKIKQ